MESLDQLLIRSADAHNAGNCLDAERFARAALEMDPKSSQAHLVIGIICAQRSDYVSASQHCELSLAANPDSVQAPLWLSTAYLKTGRKEEALRMAELALLRSPQNPLAMFQLGLSNLEIGNGAAAADAFSRVIQIAPNAAKAHHGLGCAFRMEGRHTFARKAFRRAVELDPTSVVYLADLFRAAMEESDPEEAATCAKQILAAQPEKVEAHLWLANALLEQGRPAEAELHLNLAKSVVTENGDLDYLLGWTLQSLGQITEAESYFRSSIARNPDQGLAYAGVVFNRKVTDEDRSLLQKMSELIQNDSIAARERARLLYGLGKAYEDLGDFERAITFFDSANMAAKKLKMGRREFDREAYAGLFDFIISAFNPEFMARFESVGSSSDLPIFVVGMMRSGTTLVEQILSSHSQVGAAGEQLFWTRHADRAVDRFGQMNVLELRKLADEYIEHLTTIAANSAHVVDKMPLNYTMLGLLHLAFPEAKIIHTRRSPRDTCVSIYTTPNRSRIDWANDRSDIVFAYQQYERLMDHWRATIPASSLLEVSYEDLVARQGDVSRQMIGFCGLPWEEACLRPEDNDRVVVNPSVWQVRQPMYSTSVSRWKKYEPWLGPFGALDK